MFEIEDHESAQKIHTIGSILEIVNWQNVQRGERSDYQLAVSSLLKRIDPYTLEGIFCNDYDFHVHYKVHLDYVSPKLEMTAGDPRSYPFVENEIVESLYIKAHEKKKREEYNKKRLAEGKKTGGGKGKRGIYVFSGGNGYGQASQENFAELVNKRRVSPYYVKVAPSLSFEAKRYPSRRS